MESGKKGRRMEEVREVIISLSGVYEQAGFGRETGARVVDLTQTEGTTFFCEEAAAERLRGAIAGCPLSGIHWIDSGDYHYVSLFWLERIREPFTLVMLDHHSDMKESAFGPGLLSCGSWLLESLRILPLLEQVILIGPKDDELSAADASVRGRVRWIREEELPLAQEEIGNLMSVRPVYISFDKDILDRSYCVTGWSQGSMTPETAAGLLELAYRKSTVLGIDICGEVPPEGGAFNEAAVRLTMETNRFFRQRIKELEMGGTDR